MFLFLFGWKLQVDFKDGFFFKIYTILKYTATLFKQCFTSEEPWVVPLIKELFVNDLKTRGKPSFSTIFMSILRDSPTKTLLEPNLRRHPRLMLSPLTSV